MVRNKYLRVVSLLETNANLLIGHGTARDEGFSTVQIKPTTCSQSKLVDSHQSHEDSSFSLQPYLMLT